ncbi:hypothetical protein JG688_00002474 [Phytophthora aleatoria]|uniref:CRC domain-containing protein n=1 Tax=Phytophthora aleatoria TaxID=2496075 RepID=A0A8J5J4S9_9STRA|nr:hypothetical protein JG688_00002474 [Phytophthora aleatoria]
MVESIPKRAEQGDAAASEAELQTPDRPDNATETTQKQPEPEPELEMKRQQVQTPDEAMSVISSDVSPHDSDFDFLQLNSDAGFSLLTPSPLRRGFAVSSLDMEMVAGPLASPPLSSRGSSAACSPSRFLKSPLVTSTRSTGKEKRAVKTPQRRSIVPIRVATPKRLLQAIDSLHEQEDKEPAADKVETDEPVRKTSTSATPPRTPSPSYRQQLLSRRLKDVFDRTDDDDERGIGRGAVKSPATGRRVDTSASLLDADDIQCVPSGLTTSPSEHDSFFSFANSLSPLMPVEEFENSFLSVRLSPLVALSSYELPKLYANSLTGFSSLSLPPFPELEQNGDRETSPRTGVHDGIPLILKTPKNRPKNTRGLSSAGSLAGGGISAPGSATGLVSPNLFRESFPNIQASTSATPGKDERSKLGGHSVMKMKLHTSFGDSPASFDSHHSREIQAINNSLKRKKYIRRRKVEEKRQQASSSNNVQRKLLQTPVKIAASPRTTRSPLHPWNGQTPDVNQFKTPTPRKLAPSQQNRAKHAADALMDTPLSPPVARRLIPATEPTPAPTTPVNNKKRKASQCVSMPSAMANLSGLKMRRSPLGVQQAVALAITPAKQIKREATALGKYTMLTPQITPSALSSFDSSMLKTPTPIGPSTSLTMSLQSTSKAPLGPAVMVVPAQAPKKAPCNCKKSKCLKLYCECFASGGYCDESCNCLDCANTTATEEVRQQAIASRLEKNPNAFKPKIGATATVVTDCKNQTPCVAHANGVATAGSAVSGTPSSEIDETFVSPVLQGVRKRMRIDRETWKKDFSSPFEASPGRDRERSELLQSRLLASRGVSGTPPSVRVRAMPFTSPSTPQVSSRNGAKRSRKMSPVSGEGEEQRGSSTGAAHDSLWLKERELQQYAFGDKTGSSVGKAALSAVARSTSGAERVFVLPLFGASVPPLESGVSAKIFRFLTNADLHNASLVSHLWNQVALGDTVWDHANFLPTEANLDTALRSRHKKQLKTPVMSVVSSETSKQVVSIKCEPNLAVLSALR